VQIMHFKLIQVKLQTLFMMEYHINNTKIIMILIYQIIQAFVIVMIKHRIGLEDNVYHVQIINHISILMVKHAKTAVMDLFTIPKVENVKIMKVNM
jgi:hypothetical protein